MNFEILSVSLSDNNSSSNDTYKIQEKIVNKVSRECQDHPGNKELLICADCGKAFCEKCNDKHQGHKKILEDVTTYAWKKSNELIIMLTLFKKWSTK